MVPGGPPGHVIRSSPARSAHSPPAGRWVVPATGPRLGHRSMTVVAVDGSACPLTASLEF